MGRPAKKLEGTRKGMLQIMERIGSRGSAPLYRVVCDCGQETEMTSGILTGPTVSCGCYRRSGAYRLRHGHSRKAGKSKTYKVWVSMRSRCNNPAAASYDRYGGVGIKVCPEWDASFDAFLAYMGEAPSDKHTIDRLDTSKGYEPGNCRWATYAEQAQAKSESKLDEEKVRLIRESTIPQNALAKILGVSTSCIWAVKHGKTWQNVD